MSEYHYGQRKTVKIVPKRFDVKTLEDKFSSKGYYKSCISLMKRVNKMLDIPPTMIDINVYEDQYDKIVRFILDTYIIRDHTGLTARMATLSYPMKLVGYNGKFMHRRKQLQQLPIKMRPADKVITPWDQMKDHVLHDAFDQCSHPSGRIVILTYIHGYALRFHEIVNTCSNPEHRMEYNYLDLENHKWHIIKKHSKTRTPRSFDVTKEFCEDIKPYIPSTGFLVSRKSGAPFSDNTNLLSLDIRGVSVNHIRNSYETYNQSRTDISNDQKQLISTNVLAHSMQTALAHYTRNELANQMQSQIACESCVDMHDKGHGEVQMVSNTSHI